MPSLSELLLRLLLTIVVGGLIGAEREYRSKSAGFRTMILICLGSFLFTTFSIYITEGTEDRIASNIVTGIGFLGAGVIFLTDNKVNGLTTAATIWATAALGMGIGGGYYTLVIASTLIVLVSLIIFTKLEEVIDKINQTRNYRIVSPYKDNLLHEYELLFRKYKLSFRRLKQSKSGLNIAGNWIVKGSEKHHNRFIEHILHDTTVTEFEF